MDDNRGQIGLIAGPMDRMEWLIAATTESPVYHAVLGLGAGQVISAQPGGVRIEAETNYPPPIWSRFQLSPEVIDEITLWACAHKGKPYNFMADGVIALESYTKVRLPLWFIRSLSNGKRFMCSQFVDEAYLRAGQHIFTDGRPPGLVSPGSFVPVWKNNDWWPDKFNWAKSSKTP